MARATLTGVAALGWLVAGWLTGVAAKPPLVVLSGVVVRFGVVDLILSGLVAVSGLAGSTVTTGLAGSTGLLMANRWAMLRAI